MSDYPWYDGSRNKVPILQFPIKLDLGAGNYSPPEHVRIDFDDSNSPEIVWNITRGIPLPDSSVCELFTSHFLEHLTPTDSHFVLQEIFRVCADGAKLTIKLPHADTPEGKLPCHYALWNEDSMRAIHQWFPHKGAKDYNGHFFDMKKVWRESYHLIAIFEVCKGRP